MKKLKIILMLSILLCFGFLLSSKVHVQGAGPKIFEVDDVLPATTQLKISWLKSLETPGTFNIKSATGYYFIRYLIEGEDSDSIKIHGNTIYNYNDGFISPYTDFGGDHAYIVIDISDMSSNARTISSINSDMDIFAWEDLNASSGFSITFEENGGTSVTDLSDVTELPDPLPIPTKEGYTFVRWYYDSSFTQIANAGDPLTGDVILYAKWSLTNESKIFEVGDVLPLGIIRISWDETVWFRMPSFLNYHQIKSNNNNFNFIERIDNNYYICGINIAIVPEPGDFEFVPPYTVYGEGHAFIDIDTFEWDLGKRTISTVFWREELTSRLYWEDITPDGYTQGYLEARDEFGYYDSRTDQWLSVEEYLELYGTDKLGQSDFYNNFDKYFIPAMIIVFGGAIVLTILKVFKGRE